MKKLIVIIFCCMGLFNLDLPAQTNFSDVSLSVGIDHLYIARYRMGGGAAFFDYNKDGHIDLYLTGGKIRDVLYRNNGDGTFVEVGLGAGIGATDSIPTYGVGSGDLDNDGFREIFLTTEDEFHNVLFYNNGDGTFTDISQSAGIIQDSSWAISSSMGDFDLDGDLDIYVVNYVEEGGVIEDPISGEIVGFDHVCYPNRLYMNNGDLTFTEVSASLFVDDSGCGLATAFTDFDNDADMDILIANDFGEWIIPNVLLENNGGVFSDISAAASMNAQMFGMGIAVGDYDQDRDLDYYITNIGRNALFQNQGNSTFIDVTNSHNLEDIYTNNTDSLYTIGWGTAFFDIDNDSRLDLFCTNGYITMAPFIPIDQDNPDRLFLNNGNGNFSEISVSAGVDDEKASRGFAYADYDADGDNDMLVVVIDPDTMSSNHVFLYQNQLNNNKHWLQVELEGTINNRDAYGSHIEISVGGRSWVHEIGGGSSHLSQNSSIAHFGLDAATTVDSLVITWPGGDQQLLTNIPGDQRIHVLEDSSQFITSVRSLDTEKNSFNLFPNPVKETLLIQFDLEKESLVNLELINSTGTIVKQLISNKIKQKGSQYLETNVNSFPPGFYLIKLEIDQKIISKKIIIQ